MSPVLLLSCAIGVVGSNSLALSPLAGSVAQSFPGREPADVLLASALYGAATALSAIILAPQVNRIGARVALLLAMSVLCVSLVATAAAPGLVALLLAQTVAGLAAGVGLPVIYGFAADLAPPGQQNQTVGKVLTGWTISLVLGVTISAFLADLLHWRLVYVAMAGVGALVTYTLARTIPRPASLAGQPTVAPPLDALKVPHITPVLLSVSFFMVGFYGLYAFLGTQVHDGLGLSTSMAGVASLSYGIGYGVATPLDRQIDRFGRRRSGPLIFSLLMMTYLVLSVASRDYVTLLLVCFIWGIGVHLGMTILVGRLTSISPPNRAALLGLYSGVTYASMFAGTAIFRTIYGSTGFSGTSVAAALCIAVVLAFDRRFANRWND